MTKAAELAKMGEVLTNSQIGGRRNIIINGAMQVAQRGTSIAVSSTLVYTLDRFAAENDTTTMTATQASDAPTGFEYSLKLTNGTGATATGTHINRLVTKLEGYDTNHLEIGTANAKKVTLSFHVKSSITGTYIVSFLDSGNDNGYPASYTINSANTWEKKTITLTMSDYGSWVGSTTNSANLFIHWDLGSGPDRDLSNLNAWNDGAANDFSHSSQTEWVGTTGSTFYLTGVQLEVGEQATPFEHRSFGEELALCQRYFSSSYAYGTAIGSETGSNGEVTPIGHMSIGGSYNILGQWIQPTPMRSSPTIVIYNPVTGTVDSFRGDGSNYSGAKFLNTNEKGTTFYIHATTVTATVFVRIHATFDSEL